MPDTLKCIYCGEALDHETGDDNVLLVEPCPCRRTSPEVERLEERHTKVMESIKNLEIIMRGWTNAERQGLVYQHLQKMMADEAAYKEARR